MTFRGLQNESASQGQVHKNIAKELETLVVDPFDSWAQSYKVCMIAAISALPCSSISFQLRLGQSRYAVLDTWMKAYEQAQGEVAKLKHQYLSKVRKADEAEDE